MSCPGKAIRKRLLDGECIVGSWINSASSIVAELMASSGFDFLAVDVEHSAVDLPQAQGLFQAIRSGEPGCEAFVRLQGNDCADTKRFLDAGATGVIAPLINTAQQAHQLVSAVKYPPQGARGVGFCRANLYGAHLETSVASANANTLVCVQIEHVDAVRNIDKILDVPGVDAVLIGPYDLSASMGLTAQFNHPRMVEARKRVLSACKRHGVTPGIHVVQPDVDEVVRRFAEGYRFIAYSLDITMLLNSCRNGLKAIRERLPFRPGRVGKPEGTKPTRRKRL